MLLLQHFTITKKQITLKNAAKLQKNLYARGVDSQKKLTLLQIFSLCTCVNFFMISHFLSPISKEIDMTEAFFRKVRTG